MRNRSLRKAYTKYPYRPLKCLSCGKKWIQEMNLVDLSCPVCGSKTTTNLKGVVYK